VFVSAVPHSLRGWVEADELPFAGRCLLAFAPGVREKVGQWLTLLPTDGRRLLDVTGLPGGWSIVELTPVPADDALRRLFPGDVQAPQVRLSRLGGAPVGRGNSKTYFDFAPPRFRLEGDPAGVSVTAAGRPLTVDPATGLFILPDDMREEVIEVVAQRDGQTVTEERIYLLLDHWAGNPQRVVWAVSPDGVCPAATGAAGAWVEAAPTAFDWSRLLSAADGDKVYMLGAVPGQIACCPRDPLPDWKPVWLVRLGKQPRLALGTAVWVEPLQAPPDVDPEAVRQWADFLAQHGSRVRPVPRDPNRPLWDLYREAAEHGR